MPAKFLEFDHPAATEDQPTRHLSVEVYHRKGGTSFASPRERKTGLVVTFQMVELDFNPATGFSSRSFLMFGDPWAMSFHVTTLKNHAPSKGAKLAAFVTDKMDEITTLAMATNWQAVHDLLGSFELADSRAPAPV